MRVNVNYNVKKYATNYRSSNLLLYFVMVENYKTRRYRCAHLNFMFHCCFLKLISDKNLFLCRFCPPKFCLCQQIRQRSAKWSQNLYEVAFTIIFWPPCFHKLFKENLYFKEGHKNLAHLPLLYLTSISSVK